VTTQAALIAAINAANTAGGSNSITLGANITLFETNANNSNDGPNGLPFIKSGDNLTILGNGHTIQRSTTSGNADFRLFDVADGASLNLKHLSLKNGLVSGAATPVLQGGAIFVENGGTLNLNQVNVTDNSVTNSGSPSQTTLEGGGIYNAGTANLVASSVTDNSAIFSLTNAPSHGNNQGDNDSGGGNDNGNGAIGNIVVEGGGIYNAGTLAITHSWLSNNSATSTVINGSKTPPGNIGNGDSNGDGNSGNDEGNDNGNGVSGNITVEGGGIYNAGKTTLTNAFVVGNWASSIVTNGSHNGDNNGVGNSGDHNGDLNGNGVTGDVTVAGGGIYNFSMLTASGMALTGNYASSRVANGSNNGDTNGVNTNNFDGNDNGNGVDGNVIASGGGIANDANGTANISYSNLSGNWVASHITNGNNNGDGDGVSNTGNNEGKNNGNGVVGHVNVSGGGVDNESGGAMTVTYSIVSNNSATSSVTNGNNNGDNDGNNDGDGDGLASDLTVHGGGIRNAGSLTVSWTLLLGNSATSTISNGNGNGNNVGNNNHESHDGRADGNGVTGDILVAGGGIANSATLAAANCILAFNSLKSTIANGNNNGDNDGQSDGSNNDCGNNCGNGVGGDVEVDGGGIGNSGTATVTSSFIFGNSAASTVTNGTGNGISDGGGSPSSTGTDGQGDGNGVNGNVKVIGGGTANFGTLNLVSTSVTGNSIRSNPASGSGDTTLDGEVVNGTVSVSGSNSF
jgi:hypothetical protein